MSFAAYNRRHITEPLCIELLTDNCKPSTSATDINCTAVAAAERVAAFVSFQWQQANLPPTQNVNSAVSQLCPAGQFSGSNAKCAKNAATTAIVATF